MRKNLLTIFSIFLLCYLFVPNKVSAQTQVLECGWNDTTNSCGAIRCDSGCDCSQCQADFRNVSEANCEAAGIRYCHGQAAAFGTCFEDGTVDTAIGCIPYKKVTDLQKFWITWSLGAAGASAVVLISLAGFQVVTSQGDPKKLQSAKETIVSAITGILLLVISALLLSLIGVDILQILPI